jgi:hypothetical protein
MLVPQLSVASKNWVDWVQYCTGFACKDLSQTRPRQPDMHLLFARQAMTWNHISYRAMVAPNAVVGEDF